MTVKDLKDIVNTIPSREDDRPLSLCGSLLSDCKDPIDDFCFSWIDCSDAILLCINKEV